MGRNDLCFCGSGKKQKKCHVDIDCNSIFAKLLSLYNKTDNIIKEKAQFNKLKCKKGCSECCYQNFDISSTEFYYIAYQIIKNYDEDKLKKYIASGYEMWREYKNKFPQNAKFLEINAENLNPDSIKNSFKIIEKSYSTSPFINGFPCPFLNIKEQYCEIYEYRPFICRHFGLGYLEKHDGLVAFCSNTADGIPYENYMADLRGLLDDLININAYYSEKYKSGIYDRQYPMFYFCKVTYEHFEDITRKIRERKDIPLDKFIDNRLQRSFQNKIRQVKNNV